MKQQHVAFVLIIFQGMLAVIVVTEPEQLGLSRLVVTWMSIINVGVGIALNQLKALGVSVPTPDRRSRK